MARPRADSAAAAKLKLAKIHKGQRRVSGGGDKHRASGSGDKHRASGSGDKAKQSPEVREKRVSRASASQSPEKRSHNKSGATSQTSSNVLSVDSLAKLNAANEKSALGEKDAGRYKEKVVTGRIVKERGKHKKKKRVVSGAVLEEGRAGHERGRRGGYMPSEEKRRKYGPCFWILVGVLVLLLIILIPVGVLVVGKKSGGGGGSGTSGARPSNSNLNGISQNDIPVSNGVIGIR